MKTLIRLQGVSKTFRGRRSLARPFAAVSDKVALHDINLEVPAGTLVALTGQNGSGKTTLLRIIADILSPSSGTVELGGRATFVTGQERQFSERLTGFQNLRFLVRMAGFSIGEIIPACEQMGLSEKALHDPVWTYSSGMKLRLAVARAFIGRPSVILLDEPTRSLDAESRHDLCNRLRAMRDSDAAIIVATHDVEITAACDRVVALA